MLMAYCSCHCDSLATCKAFNVHRLLVPHTTLPLLPCGRPAVFSIHAVSDYFKPSAFPAASVAVIVVLLLSTSLCRKLPDSS